MRVVNTQLHAQMPKVGSSRHIYHDPIAKIKLGKLRRRHLREWRTRLEGKPALVSRRKIGENNYRARGSFIRKPRYGRTSSGFSSHVTARAPQSDSAWQEALKPTPNADGRRTLYLDRKERRKLVAETDLEAEPFVRALCLLPLRPGALASLQTRDFERRTNELTIGKDKNGRPRRIKLPTDAAQLVAKQAQKRHRKLQSSHGLMVSLGIDIRGKNRSMQQQRKPGCPRTPPLTL